MAKDRKKLQHIHSSIPDKQPTAASLEVGEIAVNNASVSGKSKSFLSIKNSENKVDRFSSDGQIIDWVERKEVIPYSGTVDNVHLDTNRSNIEIKLNQVVAGNTVKHDIVNGAVDIDGYLVNPTDDGGLTNGAGFAIDMSQYAMIGANPTFSGITNTCYTNLNGTTKIHGVEGDCGSLLEVVIDNANVDIETANTEITSAYTVIGDADTIISGNTALRVNGTTTINREGDVTETNGSDVVVNTNGDVTVNTVGATEINNEGAYTIATSGVTTIESESNVCITSQEDADLYGSANTKVGVSCDGDIAERTEVQGKDVVINATTNNVGITAHGDIIAVSTENDIFITANKDICETAGEKASFYAVSNTNIGLNCDGSVSSTTTNIYGETINENASSANTTIGTAITNINSADTTIVNASLDGTNLNITEENIVINSCGKIELNTDDFSIKSCTDNGEINIESADVNIAADNICESASTEADLYAPTTKIGVSCEGSTATTVYISGTTINEGGMTNNNTFTTINTTANTINQSGETFNVTGETNINGNVNISGNTTIGGDLAIDIPCSGITSSTVNEALCELLARGGVTMTVETPTAESEILKTYKLWQNDVQIGEDINIPKDHLLKTAEIVYGTLNGDTFTPCSTVASTCHWYIKLVWNVFDPSTGHADDKITYMPADDFIKDIADSNPNGVVADSYNNVAVDVWYDGEKNLVSATTTPTIHASQNIYADGTVSGATVSATTLNAGTTNITGVTTITNNLNVSGETKIDNKLTVSDTLDAKKGLSKTLTAKYEATSGKSGSVTYNGSGDTTISIPTCVNHLNRHKLTITVNNENAVTYDPGKDCANSAETINITVPTSTGDLDPKTLSFTHNGSNFTYDTTSAVSFTAPHSALTIQYGTTVSGWTSAATYDTSASGTVHIPTCVDDLGRATLTWVYGDVHNSTSKTYDPGANCSNTAISDKITIPNSVEHLKEWSNNCLSINNNLCVNGTVTATGGMFTSSDIVLKDNIEYINGTDISKASKIYLKSFNYKDDPTQRKVYGVIAQDLEEVGLNELVHYDENGVRSVDYTGLLLLKMAALEKEISMLKHQLREQKK